jgi:hypothetical protein
MLHNLGSAMVYHRSSGTYIPGFLWYVELNQCHSFGGVTHCCAFLLSLFMAAIEVVTVVECALPGTSSLHENPAKLALWWFALSAGLNVIVTSMICFRILRMRAVTRNVLSPEISSMFTSAAAILIESMVPFSILGIGLVITLAQDVPPAFAFSYVWSMLCVSWIHPFSFCE